MTVAEWFRRESVTLSTRVRFPPVTPTYELGVRLAARTWAFEVHYTGSSPVPPTNRDVAQLAERHSLKVEVAGSLPAVPASFLCTRSLRDEAPRGERGICRFESCRVLHFSARSPNG